MGLAVSVERWVVDREIFMAQCDSIWPSVKPVRPGWLPKTSPRAISWTLFAINASSVVVARRTVGTAGRNLLSHTRAPGPLPWGRLVSHTVRRLLDLRDLQTLYNYPTSWLTQVEMPELLARLSGRRRHYRRTFWSGELKPHRAPVKSKRRRRKKKLTILDEASKLVRSSQAARIPLDQLPAYQLDMLRQLPVEDRMSLGLPADF